MEILHSTINLPSNVVQQPTPKEIALEKSELAITLMLNQPKVDLQLKISIGLRLFFAVLISIIGIVTASLLFMREKVAVSFSSYAVQIEFDRLEALYQSIQKRYAANQNWDFIEGTPEKRKNWLIDELTTMYQKQGARTVSTSKESTPTTEKSATGRLPASTSQLYQAQDSRLPPLPPPAPPEPPAPPSPPHAPEPATTGQYEHKLKYQNARDEPPNTSINSIDLFQRISLLDENGLYLAGNTIEGEPNTARPILVNQNTVGFLVLSHPRLPSDTMAQKFMETQKESIALLLLIAVVLSALVASVLARHFRRPIQQLVSGAEQLEMGNFDTRLAENRSDELGRLARSFNQLAHKLYEVEQQRRQWVADTSHELRTPISVIRAQLEALQDGIRPSNAENLALLHRQVMSLNKLVDELYTLSRIDIGVLRYEFSTCDLRQIVQEVINNFEEKLTSADLVKELDFGSTPIQIEADAERLRQVVSNLIENSIRYTNSPGKLSIRLRGNGPHTQHIHLIIEDSAPGVPEDSLQQLGERFFRVESSRNRNSGGAGLGLALCRRILAAHHAEISFSQSTLGGLKIDILFKQIKK